MIIEEKDTYFLTCNKNIVIYKTMHYAEFDNMEYLIYWTNMNILNSLTFYNISFLINYIYISQYLYLGIP